MTEDQYNMLFKAFISRQEEDDKGLSDRFKQVLRDLGWFLASIDHRHLKWADEELKKREVLL